MSDRQKPSGGNLRSAQDYIAARMYVDAISLIEEEIRTTPKNDEAHFLLGVAFLHTNQAEKADEAFHRAVNLNSRCKDRIARTYYEIGIHFLNQESLAGVRRG